MSRLKTEQLSSFQGVNVTLPIRASEATEAQEQLRRKWRDQPQEEFKTGFETALRDHITVWIAKNPTKAEEGKTKLRVGRSVPMGFLTTVDTIADLDKENLLGDVAMIAAYQKLPYGRTSF
jgi:hypothetical protein